MLFICSLTFGYSETSGLTHVFFCISCNNSPENHSWVQEEGCVDQGIWLVILMIHSLLLHFSTSLFELSIWRSKQNKCKTIDCVCYTLWQTLAWLESFKVFIFFFFFLHPLSFNKCENYIVSNFVHIMQIALTKFMTKQIYKK